MAKIRFPYMTSALALVALMPTTAFAQAAEDGASDGGEIVVTAQRREEKQVDVPISVANLSAETLDTSNVDELIDIARITPGVRFDFASAFFQPSIRGIGTAITTSGGGSNVGIYTDGFYSANPLAVDFDLMRLTSIQVLKGPQGTLFGRNTTGGAILVQTAEPSQDAQGEVKASYGRYNEAKLQAYATTGLGEGVAIDVEGMLKQGDGWLRRLDNGKRLGKFKNWSVRTGLKVDLGDVSGLLRFTHSDIDDPSAILDVSYFHPSFGSGAPNFSVPGVSSTFSKNRVAVDGVGEFFRAKTNIMQLTLKADLGFADLTSYTQYRHENVNASNDLDHSGAPIFQIGLPNQNRTSSQEFLLTSKPGGALQWTAGAFWFSNKDHYLVYLDNFGSSAASRIRYGGSSSTTKSLAAFFDATYEISPQLFVTAGARWAEDKVTDAYWNSPFSRARNYAPSIKDDRITPRFVIRYKPTDESSVYASYTKGYKAAIIDVGGSCQIGGCNPVNAETINAFELGYKYDGDRLNFEASAFYYDYKNLQVSIYLAGQASILNATKSEIYGLDGSVTYKLTDALTLNAGAAWTHARYKDFPNAPIYTNCNNFDVVTQGICASNGLSYLVIGQNLKNVTMQRTPALTANLGLRHTSEVAGGQLALSANWYYSSKLYFGPSGVQFPQGAYDTLSMRAQWTDPTDTWSLALWGNNVTNSRYRTGAQYNNFGIGANWSQPTTYGVELGAKF